MQVKLYSIPIPGGDPINEEMNVFMRSKKVLSVEQHLVQNTLGAYMCFCIKYLDEAAEREKVRIDYRQVLDEETFKRFSRLREIRKQISQEEVVPAYVIFTDEELAAMAKIEDLTPAAMKSIKGIGEKRLKNTDRCLPQSRPMKHESSRILNFLGFFATLRMTST